MNELRSVTPDCHEFSRKQKEEATPPLLDIRVGACAATAMFVHDHDRPAKRRRESSSSDDRDYESHSLAECASQYEFSDNEDDSLAYARLLLNHPPMNDLDRERLIISLTEPVISLDQSLHGMHEALGDGICFGLTVRIVTELQKTRRRDDTALEETFSYKHTGVVSSKTFLKLVNHEGSMTEEMLQKLRELRLDQLKCCEFSPTVRFFQAAANMEGSYEIRELFEKQLRRKIDIPPDFAIPKRILDRQRIIYEQIRHKNAVIDSSLPKEEESYWIITPPQHIPLVGGAYIISSLGEFIDCLNAEYSMLRKSKGFVEVGLDSLPLNDKGGHSIALEIHHETNRYSIIDVANGVYEFSTYEQLKRGLIVYIDHNYKLLKYNYFTARIFYPY